MLVFWVIAGLLLVGTLSLLLPSLLRAARVDAADAGVEKRAIFRQQFDELEQDRTSGVLAVEQYDLAKAELERRMLDETGAAVPVVRTFVSDRRLAVILLLVLPLAAVLLYLKIGNPQAIVNPDGVVSAEQMASDVEPLLKALRAKLEKSPDDAAGWALLGRTLMELQRPGEAVSAYENAVRLLPEDPQVLVDYADVLGVLNGRSLAGKPEELIKHALKINPHHVKALLLAATAAFDRENYQDAIAYWERLQQDLPASSELLPDISAALAEARKRSGKAPAPAVSGASISGTVTIKPALAAKLDPSATLFVFARAATGAPMPLAIARASLRDLPYHFHLDDSNALMPDHKLSGAKQVVLVARISKGGDAKPQPGDLQGMSAAVSPDGRTQDVVIDQVLP